MIDTVAAVVDDHVTGVAWSVANPAPLARLIAIVLMGQAQQELNSFGDSAIFGDKNQV